MVKITYSELEFDHIVEFSKDYTLFAAAKENGSGHLRLFLIYESTGHVYTRNGRADSWEQLTGDDRYILLARLNATRHQIPVYKVNGDSTRINGNGSY